MPRPSTVSLVRALALSCHPIPSLAVTALSAGLSALADLSLTRAVLVVAAVLTGQLSIGWSNDYLDADRDRAVHRVDKPVAAGAVSPTAAGAAAIAALIATIAFSAALGWRGGVAALVIVVCGWAYNLGLKATALSWLPYAIAFGALPCVATLSAAGRGTEGSRWAPIWAMVAGASIGVAAHLANVLPDLTADAATGVRGLPHRIGARATALGGAGILLLASAVILFGPPRRPDAWRWAGFAVALVIAAVAATTAVRDPSSKRFFLATILIAVLDLAFFALSGTRL
jgi:4-hydroxybenzoate polyprenyltransferase